MQKIIKTISILILVIAILSLSAGAYKVEPGTEVHQYIPKEAGVK